MPPVISCNVHPFCDVNIAKMNQKTLQNFPSGNTRLLPVVTFSLTPPQQVKLSPFQGRKGYYHTHFASKSQREGISRQRRVFNDVISLCAVERFHQNGQLRGKVRRVLTLLFASFYALRRRKEIRTQTIAGKTDMIVFRQIQNPRIA